ncbi:MAG: leucine-rich repeat protein [Candidatus Kariarchaeaceae archaeon]|jgi:Leucine-rich repeat (LRR) protein
MTDLDELKTVLKNLSLEDKLEEVKSKHNVFGPTTKFGEEGKLIWLDLSNLGIKEIPEHLFENLTDLQELKLFKNEIEELPEEIFSKLPNLTEIHLKDNKLTRISRDLFKHQGKLQRLFLSGNPLPESQAQNYTSGIQVRDFLNSLET